MSAPSTLRKIVLESEHNEALLFVNCLQVIELDRNPSGYKDNCVTKPSLDRTSLPSLHLQNLNIPRLIQSYVNKQLLYQDSVYPLKKL